MSPHIILATVFAEHFGIHPSYVHAVQFGGATGLAMAMLARHLVDHRNMVNLTIKPSGWFYMRHGRLATRGISRSS